MGYYRGDYYRGDAGNYYRGDPFLGGLVGGLVAKAGKWAVKRITGSGLKKAATATAIAGIAGTTIARAPTAGAPMPINLGPIGIDPGAALPGGRPFVTFGQKKYRRMNPLNPKALRRALRRAEGFEKFAARTVNALYKQVGGRRTRVFKKC